MKWFTVHNLAPDTAEVRIYDEIGRDGVNARQFADAFNAIKAAKIDLRINSAGGQIFDSLAICTAIKEHPAEVTAHVDGLAASCASWIAASCDAVAMGKSSYMMIHNPMSASVGTAEDFRREAGQLDKMADTIAQIYADKSGKTREQVRAAMDAETWFNAAEAKAWGLCDVVKDDEDDDDGDGPDNLGRRAINSLSPLLIEKFKNVPERVLAATRRPTPRPKKEQPTMLKTIERDGKHYVNVDGKELEVQLPAPAVQLVQGAELRTAGKSDTEVAAAVNKAKAEAIEGERKYRETFDTILNSTGLSGEAADEFKKVFYGKPEEDLKFLAKNVIALRTRAAGEGAGNPEKKEVNAEEAAVAKVEKEAGDRFDSEASLRKTYNVYSNDTASDAYKTGRGRHVAAARRRFLSTK